MGGGGSSYRAMRAPLVAVTGAAGFIGHAFCERAWSTGRAVRTFARAPLHGSSDDVVVDLARASNTALAQSLAGHAPLPVGQNQSQVKLSASFALKPLFRMKREIALKKPETDERCKRLRQINSVLLCF